MAENLSSLEHKSDEYELSRCEQELIVLYYNGRLRPNATKIDTERVIQIAASARNIASMWADLSDEDSAQIPIDGNSPISRAARIMYLASELLTTDDLIAHWSREASIAYLQSGNVSASRNAWLRYRRARGQDTQTGDSLLAALLPSAEARPITEIPEAVTKPWLCTTVDKVKEAQEQLYQYVYSHPPGPFNDVSLGYRISQSLPLLGSLSLLGMCSRLNVQIPHWYYTALEESSRLILMPSQRLALDRFLSGLTGNGVVCTPTSSGKTFVAEATGVLTLNAVDNGIVIYVAPYQAIAYAVHRTLTKRLARSDIAVVAAYGDTSDNYSLLAEQKAVLVCTPERLDPLLVGQPELVERAHVVVFDELHLISQVGRGAFYESLIARILFEQATNGWPRRVLGMSAVVANVDALGMWVRAPDDSRIVSRWRPNPLIVGYWRNDDRLFVRTDPEAPEFTQFADFCPQMPAWPSAFGNPFGLANNLIAPLGKRCAWYATRWSDAANGPVLVICSSRKQTREFALIAVTDRFATAVTPAVREMIAFLEANYPELSLLSHCLARGVAYHNASLPSAVRRRLEELFDRSDVSIVYATTTLAEGADFPFRAVVIASPSHYDFETGQQTAMSPLLLRNIAGRGGRSTGQLIGDVVQMYSPVPMMGTEGGAIQSHEVFLQHLLDPARSLVTSALLDGVSTHGDTIAKSQLFASLDRVLFRWPGRDSAIADYRSGMFAPDMTNGVGLRIEEEYIRNMTSSEVFGEPLAFQNSPLTLTRLGVLVMQSGFGVRSASKVWRFIAEAGWFASTPTAEQIVNVCASLGGVIPEIHELRESAQRPLKDKNLWAVLSALIEGRTLPEAFLVAENSASDATRSKSRALVSGRAPDDSTAHRRLEVFVEDLKRKISIEMPPLVRSMREFVSYRWPESDTREFDNLLAGIEAVRIRID